MIKVKMEDHETIAEGEIERLMQSVASSCNSDLLPCRIVTAEGQIKKGDMLRITGKNTLDDQYAKAKDVITTNGNEEVIINRKKNRYFITKMLVAGESWAKQVVILQEAR